MYWTVTEKIHTGHDVREIGNCIKSIILIIDLLFGSIFKQKCITSSSSSSNVKIRCSVFVIYDSELNIDFFSWSDKRQDILSGIFEN